MIAKVFTLSIPRPKLALVFAMAALCSCQSTTAAQPTITPPDSTTTPAPSATPDFTDVPEATPLNPSPEPAFFRPQYHLQVNLDPASAPILVSQQLSFSNTSDQPLEAILLIVETNREEGVFELLSMECDQMEEYSLAGGYLTLNLATPLDPSDSLEIRIEYALTLPDGPGLLNHTEHAIHMTDWYPYLPPMDDSGQWLIAEPGQVGEHLSYPSADFEVSLRLPSEASDWVVAASAPMLPEDGLLRASSTAMRVFDLTLSDQLIVTQAESLSGVPILVFSYPEHASPAAYAAQAAADSVELFSHILGPYPHAALTLVEADVFDGRESSGLFYLSDGYFSEHQLYSYSWFSVLIPHESAHQWFFSSIGNQSAFEPWLDEALCTYMERIYFERLKPDRVEWWWDFRIYAFSPEGWVDSTIYEFNSYRRYIDAVYLRGALFLERLRLIMGERDFFDFLAAYVERNQGGTATAFEFFQLVDQFTEADYADLLEEYFQRYP
jgi:hypothetical protein